MMVIEINSYSNNDFTVGLYGEKLKSGEMAKKYDISIGKKWCFSCNKLDIAEYIFRLICDDIDNMCVVKWYLD